MVAGGVLALVHAVFSISLRADQIVSGFAINFLALGLTGYIFLYHYGEKGTPDNLPQVPDVSLPIDSIPFFGPALDNLNLLVWVALLLVLARVAVRVPHADRAAAAVGGREPARGGDGRHLGLQDALPRRSSRRARWRRWAARSCRIGFVHSFTPEHDRGARLHRAGGRDRGQVAAGRGAGWRR